MSAAPDFAAELATLAVVRPHLLPTHEGRYVAIVGDQLIGVFDDAGDAWRAGMQRQPTHVFIRLLSAHPQVVMMPFLLVDARQPIRELDAVDADRGEG